MTLDGIGIYGTAMAYSMTAAFTASAALVLLYFWKQGGLAFDEDVKHQIFKERNNDRRD